MVRKKTGPLTQTNKTMEQGEALHQQSEAALRLSEQEFRTLAEAMPQIVWATRPDGWNIYFNQQWVDYTGLTMEQSYGHGWNTPFHPDDRQRAWDAWQQATQHSERYSLECRLRRADGVYRWWLVRGEPMRGAKGEILKWFGTCTDIEEIKRAETLLHEANALLEQRVAERTAALQETEQRFRLIAENLSEGLMLFDPQGTIIYQNPASLRIHGYSVQEEGGIAVGDLPVTWKRWDDQHRPLPFDQWPVSRVLRGEYFQSQVLHALRTDTGLEFDASYNGCPIYDQGRLVLAFITIREITEQRKSEMALRESEAKYRELFDNMTEEVHYWKLDRDEAGQIKTWRLVDANPPTLKSWDRTTLDEVKGKTTDEIFGPGAADHYMPVVQKIMTEGVPYVFEDYFPNLDKYFRFTSVPLRDYFITTGLDITDIKKAHAALQESESRFRTMANAMPQLAWIARADGFIFWYNQRWYDYTGTAPEEMEGWGWQSVHDASELPKVLVRWQASIAAGEPFYMTFPLRGADGVFRPFLTRGFPLKDASGRVQQWFGTNTDVSELKQAEEQVKASLAEKEVMLQEIHHRVKNNLQVISSLISLQANGSKDEAVRQVLRDVTYRVRSMAMVHEKLYQSADLAHIDFAEYTRGLLSYLWRAHGAMAAAVRLTFDLEPVSLPTDTAVTCALLLNELAVNALEHAFQGRADGEVTVSLKSGADARTRLCVADNGVGLPKGFDWRQSGSLGLRLVQMLSKQLDSTVEVSSGLGTKFEIVFQNPDSSPPLS